MATVIEAGAPLLLLVIGDLSGGEWVPAQYSFRLNRQVEQGFSCFQNIW